ncbi:hypothetical protein QBC43DRAFT_372127 [Cladorrhinum sp. PSN259]|nr:hypothetical protein QBC43DRAFT_372127 [Cladorrhinum sp. PSN259]
MIELDNKLIFDWNVLRQALFPNGENILPTNAQYAEVGMKAIDDAIAAGHSHKSLRQDARVAMSQGEMEIWDQIDRTIDGKSSKGDKIQATARHILFHYILNQLEVVFDRISEDKEAIAEGYDVVDSYDDEAAKAHRHLGNDWDIVQPAPETVAGDDERGWVAVTEPQAIASAMCEQQTASDTRMAPPQKVSFVKKAFRWVKGSSKQ